MQIDVVRVMCGKDCTIGKMYIDTIDTCYTLEDVVRPDGVKVYGETAIPAGSYRVVITRSNRFGVDMPLLLEVPQFEGIRIHAGNTAADTHGCILVGLEQRENTLIGSRLAYDRVYQQIRDALRNGEEVWINVREQ